MKKIIYLNIVILCVFLVNISLARKCPERKVNFDGNISVQKLKTKSDDTFDENIITISTANKTNYPKLFIPAWSFLDAKFDKESNKLVVVLIGPNILMCDYYKLQDNKWVLLKNVYTIGYDLFLGGYCTKIKLVDMSTIEITLNSEGSGTTNKVIEKIYLININDKYEIEKINGKMIDKLKLGAPNLLDYVSTKDLVDLKFRGNILNERLREKAKKVELTEEEKAMLL